MQKLQKYKKYQKVPKKTRSKKNTKSTKRQKERLMVDVGEEVQVMRVIMADLPPAMARLRWR